MASPEVSRGAQDRQRPSLVLGVTGVLALLVGLGSLTGLGSVLVEVSLDGRWVLVALAGAVGLALVLLPGRR